jgi:hypothetical protein
MSVAWRGTLDRKVAAILGHPAIHLLLALTRRNSADTTPVFHLEWD